MTGQAAENITEKSLKGGDFQATDSRNISRLVSGKGDPNRIIASEVGPEYWEYRRKWDLARTFKQVPAFPVQIDYELFYRCNLKCPICIMSLPSDEKEKWGRASDYLSFEIIRKLLDEGAARGQSAAGLNGICEPLLSDELPEIISYARKAGLVDVMFNTNGLLLDEDVSRRLIRSGLTRIMISIDAARKDTYEQIRVGSDFERVCENVRRFVQLRNEMGSRLPIVRVSFCVTSINEHELDEFIKTWAHIVDFFSIQHYGNTFEGKRAEERKRLFPNNYGYSPDSDFKCAQPWKRLMVRHNGDVIPCCDVSGLPLVMGNIYSENIADIWAGEKIRRLRRLHVEGNAFENPACRVCMTKWGSERISGMEA